MKATVVKPFLGNEGMKVAGEVIDVSDQRFAELEKNGLVVGVVGGKMQPRRKQPSGLFDPTPPHRTGGQTGAGSKPLLSPQVQQPRTRTSRSRRAEPEQE